VRRSQNKVAERPSKNTEVTLRHSGVLRHTLTTDVTTLLLKRCRKVEEQILNNNKNNLRKFNNWKFILVLIGTNCNDTVQLCSLQIQSEV